MNILIIEDSLFYQKVFSNFFARRGVTHTIVAHGLHGLDAYDTKEFDFVFVDINLPDVSGWDIISTINNDHGDSNIIPVTGYDIETSEILFKTMSPGKFLIKPFNDEDLGELMEWNEDETNTTGGFMTYELSTEKETQAKQDLKTFCDSMGPDVSGPLLEIFINEVQSKVPSLKAFHQQGHFSEIESAVHQLKSNCRYFGFSEYAEVCDQIEQLIVSGSTDQINHLIDHLIDQSDSLLEIVRQVKSEMVAA